MYIVLSDDITELSRKYTVLELDTFCVGTDSKIYTAWCVLEAIPINDLMTLDQQLHMHRDLIAQYRDKNWDYCLATLDALIGRWDGHLDSFYHDLRIRIMEYAATDPGNDWNGIILRH